MKKIKLVLNPDNNDFELRGAGHRTFICGAGYANFFGVLQKAVKEKEVDLIFTATHTPHSFKITYAVGSDGWGGREVMQHAIKIDGIEPCEVTEGLRDIIMGEGKNGVCYVRFEI